MESTAAPVVLISLYDLMVSESMRWLHAALTKAGHATKVIRFGTTIPVEQDFDYALFHTHYPKPPLVRPPLDPRLVELLQQVVARLRPCWIGFNVLAPHNHTARRLTEALRRVTDVPIVWGGFAAINAPDACLEHCDAICTGEGERVAVALTEAIKGGRREWPEVAGLWYRRPDGGVVRNPPGPYLSGDELDALPPSRYEQSDDEILIPPDMREYYAALAPGDGGKVNSARVIHDVTISRGCYFACSFCWRSREARDVRGLGRPFRLMSPARAVDRCAVALEQDKQRLLFWDEIFPTDPDWVREFAGEYRRRVGLPFTINLNVRLARDEGVEMLIDAGLDSVCIGPQTGSERLRGEFSNGVETDEDFRSFARRFAGRFHFCYEIICDNPYETIDDLRASLAFFLSLPRPFQIDANTMMFIEGTESSRRAVAEGVIDESLLLGREDHPGPEDRTLSPIFPRRDPVRRSLMALIMATARPWISPDQIRRWADNEDMLRDDRLLAAELLRLDYLHTRRRMYDFEWEMNRQASRVRELERGNADR